MPTFFEKLCYMVRRCIFYVLSIGPMPNHIAFIMDGNRRYANKRSLERGTGHRAGFSALISILRYCYEMGVKYVTIYAFSIDNFRRKPEEVQSTMDLMKEKIDELLKEQSFVNEYEVRLNFWGNHNLLNDPLRLSVEKAMRSTCHNTGPVLSVCVAYTSTDEIAHAIEMSCHEKRDLMKELHACGCKNDFFEEFDMQSVISVADFERHLYTSGCPDPDIVIRTSGETRLSNFLLLQSSFSHLQNPTPLWPDFSFSHLVWAILKYQRGHPYLQERSRRSKKME
ncbi:dehydrodolichyl diphosphate synthase 6 [Dendrobium catenatum]|uniref:Alkyl transferase n=1 Tax=Dendrobium catenatum TaxID=906689 RepID=A0A2I0XF97_9ASPA|nr:dehydrodolichyl diphosphate synthase 6 [Dendrobium catenatum]XP_020677038.1 dehydrodolichyl diphosphate synthase 6 [Dendrobium catenatum]PKU86587.1 Dehydrodolichyl diphosphate synthase 6 [Dendrobium catenatum]